MKRVLDILISLFALVILLPFFILISLIIQFSGKGPVFYKQERVGKEYKVFKIWKFRTMFTGSDKAGLLTVGGRDNRITPIGYFLRKYKLDELPQLINVLIGEMSLVGPRPEVMKYVEMYNAEQRQVLSVKPGITDYASIEYSNENEILGKALDPEKEYINVIMPAKLSLNLKYIREKSLMTDLNIVRITLVKIMTSG